MPELESKLQSKIIKWFKDNGWFVRKILATNCPGDPDIFAYKIEAVVWIETKRIGKTARPLQEYRHAEIKSFGMPCETVDTFEKFLKFINNLQHHQREAIK